MFDLSNIWTKVLLMLFLQPNRLTISYTRTEPQLDLTFKNPQEAGEMVWMTDRTPHESLPIPAGTQRRYVRLVCSDVAAWYADHSTPNPLGVAPPTHVEIIHGDKFIGYSLHN